MINSKLFHFTATSFSCVMFQLEISPALHLSRLLFKQHKRYHLRRQQIQRYFPSHWQIHLHRSKAFGCSVFVIFWKQSLVFFLSFYDIAIYTQKTFWGGFNVTVFFESVASEESVVILELISSGDTGLIFQYFGRLTSYWTSAKASKTAGFHFHTSSDLSVLNYLLQRCSSCTPTEHTHLNFSWNIDYTN